MPLPKFIIIGPPRTGTTWLHNVLRTVPGLFLPEIKQVHFFDKNFDQGKDWYQNFFNSSKVSDVIGEITPDYISSELTLRRISETLPGVKLILIYRDPIERAASHYRIRDRHRLYRGRSFSEVFDEDKLLGENSMYGVHLSRLLALFPVSDLLVMDFDSLNLEPRLGIEAILNFVGVPMMEIGDEVLLKRYSESLAPSRWPFLDAVLVGANRVLGWARWLLRLVGLEEVVHKHYNKVRKMNSIDCENDDFSLDEVARKRINEDQQVFMKTVKSEGINFWQVG